MVKSNHIKGLDDSILFHISWPGHEESLLESPDYEKLEMITANKEKFQCLVPINYGKLQDNDEQYGGPNALELLMPLFKKTTCTLRLESFWTYELCHGQYIKQYHEEKDGKVSRYQEYNLGITALDQLLELSKQLDAALHENPNPEIPLTKIDSIDMPYFPVNYTDGTLCDLTGNPRVSTVMYVCFEEGRHAIYSIKETYTCEYEIIVLSSLLCQHPSYRPHDVPQTNLHCVSMKHGIKRPKNLLNIEAESLKLRTHGAVTSTVISGGTVHIGVVDDGENEDGDEVESVSNFVASEDTVKTVRQSPFPKQPTIDKKLIEDFLNGEYCLQGGSGWWRYEFCYGKLVYQYHEEQDGSKIVIKLGVFDTKKHTEWIKKHPSKMYKPGKNQVSHMYSNGDMCELNRAPRQVEVKLKCKESVSPSSVTLYLLEPKSCEYILGVETPLVCPLLDNADELGLFSLDKTQVHSVLDSLDAKSSYAMKDKTTSENGVMGKLEEPQDTLKVAEITDTEVIPEESAHALDTEDPASTNGKDMEEVDD